MTVEVTLRIPKGSKLTWSEMDGNFTNLKNAVEELQASSNSEVYLDNFAELVTGNDWTAAFLAAIASMRKNPVSLLQYIGGPTITAYESGTLLLGPGVYRITPGALLITQDLGLTIKGQGSRGTNKAVKAPTTILVTGATTTTNYFGIKYFGNGARSAKLIDLDLNYELNTFVGDLVHSVQAPGFITERCRFGWHSTSYSTARSCIRTCFDEFHHHINPVFDGADIPWLSDTITELSGTSDFGGSNHILTNPVFYNATICYMHHGATRTRIGLQIINPAFDVIDQSLQRAVDFNNIDGLVMQGGSCGSSGAVVATVEWFKMENVTGVVTGMSFGDLVKAGTLINCNMEVKGNRWYCTDGLVFDGGNYEVSANEVSKGTNGFKVTADKVTSVRFGVNYFGNQVTNSYNIPAGANIDVAINYCKGRDLSTGKWLIPPDCNRVKIVNEAKPRVTFGTTTLSPSIYDSGTEFISVGTASQVVTLPTPVPGTEFTYTHIAQFPLTLNGNILSGLHTSANTSASVTTSSHVGQTLTLEAYSNVAWKVKSATGNWSFGT